MHRSPPFSEYALLIAVPAMAASSLALAADDTTENGSFAVLQEVVVTAQKREEKLHDVPMGITAIAGDELNEERLTDLTDLQSKVPGLTIQQTVPGQERLTIRGQNVGGVGSTVTTYVDDSPFGSSNALANGSLLAGDFDTWDLQRIEVLRGPQGTLYGAGSEGGLLKYVTNAPDPSKFASAFELGDEDLAHGQNTGSGKVMANMPVGTEAAFRVSGFYGGVPAFINDPQLSDNNVNHGYRAGVRAAFLANLTDNFTIKLSASGQTLHTDGSPYIDVIGAAGTPLTPPPNQLQPVVGNYSQNRFTNEPSTYKYRLYSGTLNWDLGWADATSITTYGATDQDNVSDFTSIALAPGVSAGALAESLTGEPTGVAEIAAIHVSKWTEEVRLASPASQQLEWLGGFFYTRESSELTQTLPTFFIPSQADSGLSSLETIGVNALYREWSAFGQVTYHFIPQFDVALGGRWSENKQSANQSTGGLLVDPTQLAGGQSTGTDFTYSVAPRWHLNDNTMVYARVATGYRPGGPNVLPPGVPAGVNLEYRSDSTVNYEIGSRTSLLDNRLSIDVAAFLVNWKRIQLLEIVENLGINSNGGTARSEGIEWTLGYTPLAGLTFRFTGAYTDAHLTSAAPDAGGNNGDRLPFVPRWSPSVDGEYRWAAFRDFKAFTGANWSYTGARSNDFSATTTVVNGAVATIPNPRVDLGSYTTINLRAGLDNGRWAFEVYCKNLADSRGLVYYLDQSTPNFGGEIAITQPRTVGATLTARF